MNSKLSSLLTVLVAGGALLVGTTALGATMTYENMTPIDIPSDPVTGSGVGDPYPSAIDVSGLGTVFDVNVTLHNVSHTFPGDIYVVLQGPTGQSLVLWSDAGGSQNIVGIDVTFDDEAAGTIGTPVTAGSYQVTQLGTAEALPAPAPSPGFGGDLSLYDGLDANGTWSLWVFDDAGGDIGMALDGWSITFDADVQPSIPEPSAALVFGAGLMIIGTTRRRRRA